MDGLDNTGSTQVIENLIVPATGAVVRGETRLQRAPVKPQIRTT
jgi:hypothetical protein